MRITHLPTGIAVAVQQERSQHQNRAKAIQMLKARLYELELQKREAERAETEANKTDIGWGHEIRSYVLRPYQMVKDLRTNVERSDPQKVLDGDLDEFMAANRRDCRWELLIRRTRQSQRPGTVAHHAELDPDCISI